MIKKICLSSEEIVFNNTQKQFFNSIFDENLCLNIQNKYKQFVFFGGIRAGKSFVCQLSTFLLCIKYPKTNVLYIRKYYHELEDTVIKQFQDDFGKYLQFEYFVQKREARFKNGSTIKFRALDQDGTAVLSSEYDIIAICQAEEIAEDIHLHALGRMSGKALPRPIMLLEGNPASSWVKRVYKDPSTEELEEQNIKFVEVTTEENKKNLPEGYIEYLKKIYPEFWIARFLEGEWENLDEMVFSEFREAKHMIDPIPFNYIKTHKQRLGLDYGWVNPTAIVWGCVDYDGVLTIYDEWGGTQKTPKEIFEASKKYGRIATVADYSIKRPESDGRSIWDDLKQQGMMLIESNKQELENIMLANTLLKTNRLKISKNCVELLKEIKNYKWKKLKLGEEKNRPETPIQKDNHYIDALLYLIASLEELRTPDPKEKQYKQSLQWAVQNKSSKSYKYLS